MPARSSQANWGGTALLFLSTTLPLADSRALTEAVVGNDGVEPSTSPLSGARSAG